MKQETLEEAADRASLLEFPIKEWYRSDDYTREEITAARDGFKRGAKWQQQNSYSEEEVEVLIKTTYEETMRAMVDWFTNNKDKNQEDMESAINNYVYPRLAEKGINFKKN
jgi:hypothetical protein